MQMTRTQPVYLQMVIKRSECISQFTLSGWLVASVVLNLFCCFFFFWLGFRLESLEADWNYITTGTSRINFTICDFNFGGNVFKIISQILELNIMKVY